MDVIPTTIDFALQHFSIIKVAAIQMGSALAVVDASIPVWAAKYNFNAIRPDTGKSNLEVKGRGQCSKWVGILAFRFSCPPGLIHDIP